MEQWVIWYKNIKSWLKCRKVVFKEYFQYSKSYYTVWKTKKVPHWENYFCTQKYLVQKLFSSVHRLHHDHHVSYVLSFLMSFGCSQCLLDQILIQSRDWTHWVHAHWTQWSQELCQGWSHCSCSTCLPGHNCWSSGLVCTVMGQPDIDTNYF